MRKRGFLLIGVAQKTRRSGLVLTDYRMFPRLLPGLLSPRRS